MADMKLEGMDSLLNAVKELGRKGARIENTALLKAAEPILDDAVSNAPENTGKGKRGLKIGRPRSKGDTKYILVGIQKGDNSEIFYMKFHEWGTTKLPARPYLGPALEKNKDKAIAIIKDELKRGLGL